MNNQFHEKKIFIFTMKSFSQKKITCATNDFSLFFQALATLFCPTTWVLRQGLDILSVNNVAIAECLTQGGILVMLSWIVLEGVA